MSQEEELPVLDQAHDEHHGHGHQHRILLGQGQAQRHHALLVRPDIERLHRWREALPLGDQHGFLCFGERA